MSININPPQTEAHETKLSRNLATSFGSPAGVRSDFGSRFVGRLARRRSRGRPPPESRAGGPPPPAPPPPPPAPPPPPPPPPQPPPRRVSPRAAPAPPLVRRDGRYGGALRDSSARRSASAVGQRASGSFSSERMTHDARSSGQVGVLSWRLGACSVICLSSNPGTVGAEKGNSPASIW